MTLSQEARDARQEAFPGRTEAARRGAESDVPLADDGRRRRRQPERGAAGDRAQHRRLADAAAVDRGRVRARLRSAAPPRRCDRRPDRPQAGPGRRPRHLRPLLARGDLPERPRRADRATRRDGRRRGDDHAGHAVRDHDRLPARGARQGRRDVGRRRRRRRRARPARLGRPARVAPLAVDLRPQRRPRSRRARRDARDRAGHPRDAAAPARPRRHAPLGRGSRSARLRRHRRPRARLGRAHDGRLAGLRCSSGSWRSCSGSCAAASRCSTRGTSPGAASPPEPSRVRPVLRGLRLPLPRAPVPPARDGLLAAAGGRRARADGARRHPALAQGSRDRGAGRRPRRRRDRACR